jgi:hypothetical protein
MLARRIVAAVCGLALVAPVSVFAQGRMQASDHRNRGIKVTIHLANPTGTPFAPSPDLQLMVECRSHKAGVVNGVFQGLQAHQAHQARRGTLAPPVRAEHPGSPARRRAR